MKHKILKKHKSQIYKIFNPKTLNIPPLKISKVDVRERLRDKEERFKEGDEREGTKVRDEREREREAVRRRRERWGENTQFF
jgi:hypothetical protein